MDVSKNRDTPKSSSFIGVFHYKPSILGYHYSWKHSRCFQDWASVFRSDALGDHGFRVQEHWILGASTAWDGLAQPPTNTVYITNCESEIFKKNLEPNWISSQSLGSSCYQPRFLCRTCNGQLNKLCRNCSNTIQSSKMKTNCWSWRLGEYIWIHFRMVSYPGFLDSSRVTAEFFVPA